MGVEDRKTVFVLHTSFALVKVLEEQFRKQLSGVRIVNLVDDSLLADVRAAGGLTPSVTRRMVGYALLAQSAGAHAIFNACSSVGEAADMIQQTVDIPVVKIDERMAEEAAAIGGRVAVVATVATTLEPTGRLVERKGQRGIQVRRHLVNGAFDVLMAGDVEKHDRMVTAEIERAAAEADVVVLAQASMARLVPQLAGKIGVPLLASPERGVAQLKETLAHRPGRAFAPGAALPPPARGESSSPGGTLA